LTAAWEAHEGTSLATATPIALLLFSARDTFSRGDIRSTFDRENGRASFGVISGAIADRAAAAANRESAGERAEPMMLALVNLAAQNHAHQATHPAAG
jgi:hypothetical protein